METRPLTGAELRPPAYYLSSHVANARGRRGGIAAALLVMCYTRACHSVSHFWKIVLSRLVTMTSNIHRNIALLLPYLVW